MDYSVTRLRITATNYHELKCYAYDGGPSYWSKLSGEPGITTANWTRVIEVLADFDNAVDHFGKRWKLDKDEVYYEALHGRPLWMGWELKEMCLWLNAEGKRGKR